MRHGADYDIAGLRMNDGAELRVHRTGKAVLKLSVKSQGQGHETTFAQIVAEELRPPARGRRGSRATPTTRRTGSAPTRAARRPSPVRHLDGLPENPRRKAQKIAAHLLEASEDDLEGRRAASSSRARPRSRRRSRTSPSRAYTNILEDGGRPRGRLLLRPAEHDLPVRHVRRGRRGRSRHRRLEGAPRGRRDDCGVRSTR